MVKKYNISKPEKYVKDGQEKTYWANVGTMTEFTKQDGTVSRIIEIPAIGLKANVFEIMPKENQQPQDNHPQQQNAPQYQPQTQPYPQNPQNGNVFEIMPKENQQPQTQPHPQNWQDVVVDNIPF